MSTAQPPSDGDRPTAGESAEATPATPETPRRAPRATAGTGAGRASSRSTMKPAAADASPEGSATGAEGAAAVPAAGTAAKGTARSTAAAKKPAAARSTAAAKTPKASTSGTPAASSAAKKPATTRARRTTAKPTPIAPEGEAPDIMDAPLSAREPLAAPRATAPSAAAAVRAADSPAGGGAASAAPAAAPMSGDTSSSPAEPLAESDLAATKRLPTAEEVYGTSPAAGQPTAAAVPAAERVAVPATAETELIATGPDASVFEETGDVRAQGAPASDVPPAAVPAAVSPDGARGAAATGAGAAPASATSASTPNASATGAPAPGAAHAPHGRTVTELADRLDDSRFFSSLFDFTFTNYVTRKLSGPVYVVGLVLIGLGVVVGFANALTSAVATHAPIGAFVFLFGVLITLVGAMLAVLLLRVGIEVFCAIIEIAQNTRRRRPPGE